jgi:hypothetical protein
VKINIEVVALCEFEDARDLAVRIAVDIGGSADRPRAVLAGLHQQFIATGIVEQSFLRKHAELQTRRPSKIVLQATQGMKALHPDPRIDLDMGAQLRRALSDGLLQCATASRVNILFGEVALGRRDRLRQVQRSEMHDLSRWMWVSTTPGTIRRPPSTISRELSRATIAKPGAIAAIRPSLTPMSTGSGLLPAMRPWRKT